jgi:hypothetical protein
MPPVLNSTQSTTSGPASAGSLLFGARGLEKRGAEETGPKIEKKTGTDETGPEDKDGQGALLPKRVRVTMVSRTLKST